MHCYTKVICSPAKVLLCVCMCVVKTSENIRLVHTSLRGKKQSKHSSGVRFKASDETQLVEHAQVE